MDIKELNKKQLVLLTLLITFVVSIATGIVTVSLMQQLPERVPQIINNVIQRTIENVTTIQVPAETSLTEKEEKSNENTSSTVLVGDGDVIVSIYSYSEEILEPEELPAASSEEKLPVFEASTPKSLGQGIIISDVGLILVESKILTDEENYKVILGETDFNASVLKKYGNGFTILKITPQQIKVIETEEPEVDEKDLSASAANAVGSENEENSEEGV